MYAYVCIYYINPSSQHYFHGNIILFNYNNMVYTTIQQTYILAQHKKNKDAVKASEKKDKKKDKSEKTEKSEKKDKKEKKEKDRDATDTTTGDSGEKKKEKSKKKKVQSGEDTGVVENVFGISADGSEEEEDESDSKAAGKILLLLIVVVEVRFVVAVVVVVVVRYTILSIPDLTTGGVYVTTLLIYVQFYMYTHNIFVCTCWFNYYSCCPCAVYYMYSMQYVCVILGVDDKADCVQKPQCMHSSPVCSGNVEPSPKHWISPLYYFSLIL